jgi:hypothetical protein
MESRKAHMADDKRVGMEYEPNPDGTLNISNDVPPELAAKYAAYIRELDAIAPEFADRPQKRR